MDLSLGIDDPHKIIQGMRSSWALLEGDIHVICTNGDHSDAYLDKTLFLIWEVAERIATLLALGIPKGSLIIGPTTMSDFKLAQKVAELSGSDYIQTEKVGNTHIIPSSYSQILSQNKWKVILIDDILNNGHTFEQVKKTLIWFDREIDEVRVMVNRNPVHSVTLSTQIKALATIQMHSWNTWDIPDFLEKIPISSKYGRGRYLVPQIGKELTPELIRERYELEQQGCKFNDWKKVIQMGTDSFILAPR